MDLHCANEKQNEEISDFFSVSIASHAPEMCHAALAKELNNKHYSLICVHVDAAGRGRKVWQAQYLRGKFYLRKGQA